MEEKGPQRVDAETEGCWTDWDSEHGPEAQSQGQARVLAPVANPPGLSVVW